MGAKAVILTEVSTTNSDGLFGPGPDKRHATLLGSAVIDRNMVDFLLDQDSTVIHMVNRRTGIVYSANLIELYHVMEGACLTT